MGLRGNRNGMRLRVEPSRRESTTALPLKGLTMATINRVGTVVLLVGGLALASLMAYTLLLADGTRALRAPGADVGDVALVFPEQDSAAWEDFRRGVLACRDRGLIGEVLDGRSVLVMRTRGGHRLRFLWSPASGFVQTCQVVRELMDRPVPPLAVVGSNNTALTAVLAEAMRDAAGPDPDGGGPALLVPWATALLAEPASPGAEPVPLLGIYPGRTFRFCPDNRRQAELLVRFALDQDGGRPPAGVLVVADPDDPFSRDLARAFREALRETVPGAPVEERDAVPLPVLPSVAPDPSEAYWAESVWAEARDGAASGPTWLVLPLQGEPTRRLLKALGAMAPRDAGQVPLRVLCGDGIGVGTLTNLAGTLPFPVWVASPAFAGRTEPAIPEGAQVMAEIALALARARDQATGPEDLAAALRRLQVPAEALGRSIAFEPSGERRGADLGQILAIVPGSNQVVARSRRPDGGWSDPVPVAPERP